ncbi:hypothetical protein CORC01_05959 [Colletotrichum orchidophilum]|uniref:Uncharacterized protein n=1 Tax=Colletotrichum orchidophilum TaxID=1209926 RepID=A0A1G4BBE7_9PEZI|nr:uncharacterized protein CORC01_05959 [Colletotrichum orchidophilum]OHE98693.1 hypothetical protein CORC01_05959 [Colletotrichum orchidophilum]
MAHAEEFVVFSPLCILVRLGMPFSFFGTIRSWATARKAWIMLLGRVWTDALRRQPPVGGIQVAEASGAMP